MATFQARATMTNSPRRFCPRRILATHEPAVCQQTPSHKPRLRFPKKKKKIWNSCQRDRSSEYSNCHGDGPLQAETALLRQRYRSREYSKCHQYLCDRRPKTICICSSLVHTSCCRPPIDHLALPTTWSYLSSYHSLTCREYSTPFHTPYSTIVCVPLWLWRMTSWYRWR